jgi:hypothetical protein
VNNYFGFLVFADMERYFEVISIILGRSLRSTKKCKYCNRLSLVSASSAYSERYTCVCHMKSSFAVIVASKLLDGERLIETRGGIGSAEFDVFSCRGTVNAEATPKGQYMLSTGNLLELSLSS